MLSFYNFLIPFFQVFLRFLALFSPSIKEFLQGRMALMERWRRANLGSKKRIWFHVASVGELEQARPVIEALRERTDSVLVLTYFSPSLPRLLKDWSFVQYADYLPLDTEQDMRELMKIIAPELLVLNRYDLWPNQLAEAGKANIPILLINASTPPLGWFGWLSLALRRPLFKSIAAWTFVDSVAAAAWEPYVIDRAKGYVAGDPRVDRALERVEKAVQSGKGKSTLDFWQRREFCLVAGSTWDEDEILLLKTWKKLTDIKEKSLVVVPHEPTREHLQKLLRKLRSANLSYVLFSELKAPSNADVLVVDQRGFLAEIYGLGQLAYVGGGFGKQIHSIIEPLAHGLTVAFGPHFSRSPEAVALCAAGATFSVRSSNSGDFAQWIRNMLSENEEKRRAKESLRVFLQIHRGAGLRVAEFLLGCLKNSGTLLEGRAR